MPKAKPSSPDELFPYISRVDTARFLVVGVQQVDKWSLAGVLHPYKVGRKVIFRRDEVARLAATGGLPALPRNFRPRKSGATR